MGQQSQMLNQDQVQKTMVTILNHVLQKYPKIEFRLCGTAAALLHGIKLPATDIDILVRNRKAVDTFAAELSKYKCLIDTTWLPMTKQYYCVYEINGVEVGISDVEIESDKDTIETFGQGPWVHYVLLKCGSYNVPTVTLELRLITELFRKRPDRYHPIIQYMQINGCDLNFIRRAISTDRPDYSGIPKDVEENIIKQLIDT